MCLGLGEAAACVSVHARTVASAHLLQAGIIVARDFGL